MGVVSTVPPIAIALFIAFIINGIFLFITSAQSPNKYQQKLTQFFLFSTLLLCGNFIRSVALTEGAFTIAQKMIFLGGSLMYYTMFSFYCDFCKIYPPRPVKHFLTLYTVVVCLGLMTYDVFSNWHLVFVNSDLIVGENGFLTMPGGQNAGPFLWAYRILNITFTISLLTVSILNLKNGKSKKGKLQSRILLFVIFLSLVGYVLEFAIPGTTLFPFTLTIAAIILMVSVYKIKIYDLHDTIHVEAFESSKSGIVALGTDNSFMGANPLAMRMFPALSKLSLSESITEENALALCDILSGEETEFNIDDKIYEASIDLYEDRDVKLIWFNDVTAQKEYVKLLKNYQTELEAEVKEKTEHIRQMQDKIMIGMSDIIENRDGSTGGHVKRTSYIVNILLNAMKEDNYPGVTDDFCDIVSRSAPMHDLGKIAISDSILQKPGKLDDDEFSIMKSHSARGAEMVDTVLEGIEETDIISITENIARSHHEKWNGMGYPDNLKEEEIPLEARVMAVADVYDALVSKRCYKPPMSFDVAYGIMDESFGSHFDPNLKKYFDQCRDKIEDYYKAN